jgi:hypothetical protein
MSKLPFLICLALFAATSASAQCGEEKPSDWLFQTKSKTGGIGLGITLGYTGADVVEGLDTRLLLGLGASWDDVNFYQKADGRMAEPSEGIWVEDTRFKRVHADWSLGVAQGLLWAEKAKRNQLEGYLHYRGVVNGNQIPNGSALILNQAAPLPDTQGILMNSVFTGLTLNLKDEDKDSKKISGILLDASVEWAPRFAGNALYGDSDFVRLNLQASGFLPLLAVTGKEGKTDLTVLLCGNLVADWLAGPSIPTHALSAIGGQEVKPGLGGWVRGLDNHRFATELKIVDNLELRVLFPSLIHSDFTPGVLAFLDSGYYASARTGERGLVATTGAGIVFVVFNSLQATAYLSYVMNGTNMNGAAFVPFSFAARYQF